jgi:hypothetical protein
MVPSCACKFQISFVFFYAASLPCSSLDKSMSTVYLFSRNSLNTLTYYPAVSTIRKLH